MASKAAWLIAMRTKAHRSCRRSLLGVGMGALGRRLGQGQAQEAGTEKSCVSGISLSRAAFSI